MLGPTYELTVDLATITGEDSPAVLVSVAMAEPQLVYPLGAPTETLYPSIVHSTTDAAGSAVFDLLPSSLVGNYCVTIGKYMRKITMPNADARLSTLGDPVVCTMGAPVVPVAPVAVTVRFGTSLDEVPEAAEATIAGVGGRGTIVAYLGERRHLIFRPVVEGDIERVLYSDDSSQTNQVGVFTKYAQSVSISGSQWAAWVSNQLLTQDFAVTLTVT